MVRWTMVALALSVAGWTRGTARALEPKDVAVIFNSKDPQSLGVAEYYIHARGIPRDNLIEVACNPSDAISEAEYRTSVVPQVRKGLADHKLTGRVKCLATVYGMPLMIGAEQVSASQRAEAAADQKLLTETLQRLDDAAGMYDHIGAGPATAASRPARQPGDKVPWPELIQRLNSAASAAGRRVEALSDADRPRALGQMEEMQRRVAGINGVLLSFHVSPDAPDNDPGRAQLDALRKQLNDINGQVESLGKMKTSPQVRAQLITLQERARGWVGEAQQLLQTIQALSPDETESCFDNELALLFTDQTYPRYRWLPNPRNVELYPTAQRMAQLLQPIMVTRLDGLTPTAVTHMIDTGIAVEKKGLEGKLYLDARHARNRRLRSLRRRHSRRRRLVEIQLDDRSRAR